jgi:hypothetical protein
LSPRVTRSASFCHLCWLLSPRVTRSATFCHLCWNRSDCGKQGQYKPTELKRRSVSPAFLVRSRLFCRLRNIYSYFKFLYVVTM